MCVVLYVAKSFKPILINHRRMLFFASVCIAVFCGSSEARLRYVARTGSSDSNDGSLTTPWATIGRAANQARAGDTVYIKSGTYVPTGMIIFANSGTPGQPIVLRNFQTDSVIIDAQDKVPAWNWSGVVEMDGKKNIRIEGLRIINSHYFGFSILNSDSITLLNNSTYITGGSGIYIDESKHLLIRGNNVRKACQSTLVSDGCQECISLGGCTDYEVCYNEVWDRPTETGCQGGEGLDSKGGCANGKIHHNSVHDLRDLGIYLDGGYTKRVSKNIEIYDNTVYRCGGGIILEVETDTGAIDSTKVYNNVVYTCGSRGISAAGYMADGPISNIAIVNNTIYDCVSPPGTGIWIEASNVLNKNFLIRNNVLSKNTNAIKTESQTYLTIDHNLIDGGTTTSGQNTVTGDPGFVSAATADFRLKSNSIAINAGSSVSAPSLDFSGNARVGNVDIGAYEYQPATLSQAVITSLSRSTLQHVFAGPFAISQAQHSGAKTTHIFDLSGRQVPQPASKGSAASAFPHKIAVIRTK